MNPEPQTGGPDPPLSDIPAAPEGAAPVILQSQEAQPEMSEPSTLNQQPPTTLPVPVRRSPRGKIARLPKATRDKLNFMLRDGLKYEDIRANLGTDAKDITVRNLSGWHSSPSYQHWLLQQDWLEDLRLQQEPAFDLLNDFDAARFNQAVLQLAVSRLFLAFRHLEPSGLNDKLGGNARIFANLVHALARACRENTHIEQYRDACAKAVAAELKQLNVDRELSDNEYDLLVNKMDKVFKVARRRLAAPKSGEAGPVPPDLSRRLVAPKPSVGGSPTKAEASEGGPSNPLTQMPLSPTH